MPHFKEAPRRKPAERLRWGSEEIPITAQFSPQGVNGAVMGISELERATRLELATSTLARWRSTR